MPAAALHAGRTRHTRHAGGPARGAARRLEKKGDQATWPRSARALRFSRRNSITAGMTEMMMMATIT